MIATRKLVCPTLAISIAALASTAAGAADLPSRRAPPVYAPPPIPVFTWTGFYVGGNAGYAFGDNNDLGGPSPVHINKGQLAGSPGTAGTVSFNSGGFPNNGNRDGFTGGGQIGFNYQLGSGFGLPVLGNLGGLTGGGGGIVIGVEADAQYLGIRNDRGPLGPFGYAFAPDGGNGANTGVAFTRVPGKAPTFIRLSDNGQVRRDDYFGTVRGRLGFAFDRVLVFGTGGFAYSSHATGVAYGGGVEYAITNNITVRAEYLRVDLGNNSNRNTNFNSATFTPTAGTGSDIVRLNTTTNFSDRERFNVVRAAINYKFDVFNPVAPVVARY